MRGRAGSGPAGIPRRLAQKAGPAAVDPHPLGLVAQTSKGFDTADSCTTDPIDTTGATYLLIHYCYHTTATITSATDNKGNSWSLTTNQQDGTGTVRVRTAVPTSNNPIVTGPNHTFTIVGTGTYPAIHFSAWKSSIPVSLGTINSAGGNLPHGPGNLTTGTDGELVISAVGSVDNLTGVSQGTILCNLPNNSGQYALGVAYNIVPTSGTILNPVWSSGSTGTAAVGIDAYRGTWLDATASDGLASGVGAATAVGASTALPLGLIAQSNSGGVSNFTTTTPAVDTTGATLLVAHFSHLYLNTPTISDNKGNTWTQLYSTLDDVSSSYVTSKLYYVNSQTPNVGTGHAITVSGGATYPAAHFMAWRSGTAWSSSVSGSASGMLPHGVGGVTTAANNQLLISTAGTVSYFTTVSQGTVLANLAPTGNSYGAASAYKIVPTSGTAIDFIWASDPIYPGGVTVQAFSGTWLDTNASDGLASGVGTATAVAIPGPSIGSAAGVGAATAVALLPPSVGSASGVGAATGVSPPVITNLVLTYTPGGNRNDHSGRVGVRFDATTGQTYNRLGVRCATGNSGLHYVGLYDSGGTLLRSANINLTGGTLGTFYYEFFTSSITLTSGSRYYLSANSTNGDGQQWADTGPTTLVAGVTNIHDAWYDGSWHDGPSSNQQYVGVDLDYVSPDTGVGLATGRGRASSTTPGLIAHTESFPGGTSGSTSGIDTTGANFLLFHASGPGGSYWTGYTFSDSYGNTWTQLGTYKDTSGDGTGWLTAIYYVDSQNPIVGPGHTISWSGSLYAGGGFTAWNSAKPWSFDQEISAFGPLPHGTGVLIPAEPGELLIHTYVDNNNPGGTPTCLDPVYTLLDFQPRTDGNNPATGYAYQIADGRPASNPFWPRTDVNSTVMRLAAFKGNWTYPQGVAKGTARGTSSFTRGYSTAVTLPSPGLVAHTEFGARNGPTTSSAINTTGANLLFVHVVSSYYPSPSLPVFTDNYGNTWTRIVTLQASDNGSFNSAIYYVNNSSPKVGPGHTISWASTSDYYAAFQFAAFYSSTDWSLDSYSSITPDPAPINTGLVRNNGLIISTFGSYNGNNPTGAASSVTPPDFTTIAITPDTAFTNYPAGYAYRRVGSFDAAHPTVDATWSSSGTDYSVGHTVNFDGTWEAGAAVGLASGIGLAAAQSPSGVDSYASGVSTGTGLAAGQSRSDVRPAGASAGVGAATATGRDDGIGAGATAGLGTATSTSTSDVRSAGASAGLGTATATGRDDGIGSGAAAGLGAAASGGRSDANSAAASAGVGTASGASAAGLDSPAPGTSAGLGAATAGGRSDARSAIASAGIGAATGTSRSDALSAGATAGVGAATGQSKADSPSVGVSAGIGAAAGTRTSDARAAGAAAGIGIATAVGDDKSIGSAAGIGAAVSTGRADALLVGSAAGIGAAVSTGKDDFRAVGNAAGVGEAVALADASATTGDAPGVGVAAGSGRSDARIAGTAAGVGAAAAVGRADFIAVGAAAGLGTATGQDTSDARSAGTAAGVGVAAGSSAAGLERFADGAAAGVGAAVGQGKSDARAAGSAAGIGTAAGTSFAGLDSPAVGASAGLGTATGQGRADARIVGTAAGVGTATTVGRDDFIASGIAAGIGAAAGAGRADARLSGVAAGIGAAVSTGAAGAIGTGAAAGVGAAVGLADIGSTTGRAAGIGAAAGAGRSDVRAAGAAAGVGAAAGQGSSDVRRAGIAAGIGTAAGVGIWTGIEAISVGASAGQGTASASITVDTAVVGYATGLGTAIANVLIDIRSVGHATGVGRAVSFSVEPGSVIKVVDLIGYRSPPVALVGVSDNEVALIGYPDVDVALSGQRSTTITLTGRRKSRVVLTGDLGDP